MVTDGGIVLWQGAADSLDEVLALSVSALEEEMGVPQHMPAFRLFDRDGNEVEGLAKGQQLVLRSVKGLGGGTVTQLSNNALSVSHELCQ